MNENARYNKHKTPRASTKLGPKPLMPVGMFPARYTLNNDSGLRFDSITDFHHIKE